MSTIEDFRKAPVGATATHKATGSRAMKIDASWFLQNEIYFTNREMVSLGYRLNPSPPSPTTAREALNLAWELAHPVKEGQVIPKGARYLENPTSGVKVFTASRDMKVSPELVSIVRTLEPLSDPEPDWLDAPAVLATCGCRGIELWQPHDEKDGMWVSASGEHVLWSTLRDVTPLYPKGQDA